MAANPLGDPYTESHHCLGGLGGLVLFLGNCVPSRALTLELDTLTVN
jgi:hypothetical protein